MNYSRYAEHHATNRTSLAGLNQNLLFFGPPHITLVSGLALVGVGVVRDDGAMVCPAHGTSL